jgi:hypothetical protein
VRANENAMPRLFNVEVFNQTISGDPTNPPVYYSNRELQATLGSAEYLSVQVIVEGATVAGAVTTVYQCSNTANEDEWFLTSGVSKIHTITGLSGTNLPQSFFWNLNVLANDNGAFARFRITYSSASMVTVKIIVCGRTN